MELNMARARNSAQPLIHLLLLFLASQARLCLCQTPEDLTRVSDERLTANPRLKPVKNESTVLTVNMDFNLISIQELDTVKQKLTSSGWLEVQWFNELATWNGWEYGNAYVLRNPDPAKLWRPSLTVQNTVKEMKPVGQDFTMIMLIFNGLCLWYPSERFETSCRVDVTYFPFDIQRCQWKYFFWGTDAVDLQVTRPDISLDAYTPSGEWELLSTKAWAQKEILAGENMSFVFYQITIRRRPGLLALTLVLPVISLALVNVFVFTIPSESGERLSYSVTLLLSFGVFMSFIVDSMPSASESVSYLALELSFLLVLSALYVLLCIYTLSLFHRDTIKHPVPQVMQNVVIFLEMILCLGPPSVKTKVTPVGTDQKMSADDFINGGVGVGVGIGGGVGGIGAGLKRNQGPKTRFNTWVTTRKLAYSNPEDMTWRRVSRSLDKFFFRFFFLLVIASSIWACAVLLLNYYGNHD